MIITLVLVYIIPDHNHWFENFEYKNYKVIYGNC